MALQLNKKSPKGRYTEDFEEIELLGKSGFAVVYQCKHRLNESLYAVKKIPFNDQQLQEKIREVKILAAVQHPRVVRYYQCWIEDGVPDVGSSLSDGEMVADATKTLFVAMEFCASTIHAKLEKEILKKEVFEPELILRIFKDLLEGLTFIHGSGVIHGDISRDNVFMDAQDQAKIGNFGLARSSGDDEIAVGSVVLGNEMYQAPELSSSPPSITTKVDMYALGLLLFEISYLMETDSQRFREFKKLKETRELPEVYGFGILRDVIPALLLENPQHRPSAADLLHKYFPF